MEKGTKDQNLDDPRSPVHQALLSATPRLNPDDRGASADRRAAKPAESTAGLCFRCRCRRRFGQCTQLQPQLKKYGGELVACFAVKSG
ncbi:hypothetical protein ACNKHQ_20615 [Shigella flexneri]